MPHSTALPLASGKSFFFFPSELPSCFFFFYFNPLYLYWLLAFRSLQRIWPGTKWDSALGLEVSFSNSQNQKENPASYTHSNYHTTKLTRCITCPSLVNFCFLQLPFLQRMSLRHMENLPLHHPSPPGPQRLSWKRWLLYLIIAFLAFLYFSALLFTLLSSKVRRQ